MCWVLQIMMRLSKQERPEIPDLEELPGQPLPGISEYISLMKVRSQTASASGCLWAQRLPSLVSSLHVGPIQLCDRHLADMPQTTAAVGASCPLSKDAHVSILLHSAGVIHHCKGCCLVFGWKMQLYMQLFCKGYCLVFGWKMEVYMLLPCAGVLESGSKQAARF